jgi:hypothetical protein
VKSMTSIVRRMNKTIVDLVTNNQIGFDLSVRLSERTNEYFTKLLGQWLVSDNLASYFVFELGGFEFLLDTIGNGGDSIEPLVKDLRKSNEPAGQMSQQIKSIKTTIGSDVHISSL